MEETPHRRDCDLPLRDATEGNLPPVCIRCGEATNQFYPAPLYYRWKRIVLRLPLCASHKNDWRRRSYALGTSWFGFLFLIAGLILLAFSDGPPDVTIEGMVAMAALDLIVLGLSLFYGCFCLYAFLMARGIQIRQLSEVSVTLARVAPEFIEALRSYDQEALWDQPNASPSAEVMRVLEAARQEAYRLQHEYLGTDHILLGLFTKASAVVETLPQLRISRERIQEEIAKNHPTMPGLVPPGNLVYTPQVRRAIKHSVAQAQAQRSGEVGPHHLLLGLLQEQDGQAVQTLLALGVDVEELRDQILKSPELDQKDKHEPAK